MEVGDLLNMMEDKEAVLIRTPGWKMENSLSVGTIRELMWEKVAELQVKTISPRNCILYIWTKER